MPDTGESLRPAIEAAAAAVIAHADELTALDQAIGDGDHGINMKRGAEALLADLDAIAAKARGEALAAAGMTLVMKIGGASGPLYGSLFMAMGKALTAGAAPVDAYAAGVDAVKARGKATRGQKTMLDVLIPVLEVLQAADDPAAMLPTLGAAAEAAVAATKDMRAEKGRASFLGERSIGHIDPGARSSALMIEAICDSLGD